MWRRRRRRRRRKERNKGKGRRIAKEREEEETERKRERKTYGHKMREYKRPLNFSTGSDDLKRAKGSSGY